MDHFNLAHFKRRIVSDVSTANTGPEEPNQPVPLLRLGQCAVSPRCAKVLHGVEVNFVQVLVSLDVRPNEKLLAEDRLELGDRGLLQIAAFGVG